MRSSSPPRAPYQLLALFVVLASAIGAMAYWFHLEQKASVEQDIRNQLSTVADIKVRDLSMWWSTRLGEARAILADRMELTAIRRVLAGNASASERAAVYAWMDALSRHLQYMSVQLLDRHGRLVLLVGQRLGSDEHLRQIAGETLRRSRCRGSGLSPRCAFRTGPSRTEPAAETRPRFGGIRGARARHRSRYLPVSAPRSLAVPTVPAGKPCWFAGWLATRPCT